MLRTASVKVELRDLQEGTRGIGRRESYISVLLDRSGKLPQRRAALCSAILQICPLMGNKPEAIQYSIYLHRKSG